jgi:hypothetical protein
MKYIYYCSMSVTKDGFIYEHVDVVVEHHLQLSLKALRAEVYKHLHPKVVSSKDFSYRVDVEES